MYVSLQLGNIRRRYKVSFCKAEMKIRMRKNDLDETKTVN